MKRVIYLLVAVLMILPMIVSCGSQQKGTPTEVANVKVLSMYSADAENNVAEEASVLYEGAVTAYVEEGAALTLQNVVDAYANDIDGDAFYDEDTHAYTKLAGLVSGNGWFWNYTVNGKEVGLDTEIQATDTIQIVYEKI